MKVTVTTEMDDVFTLEVSAELELENFLALCEFETNGQFKANQSTVLFNGHRLRERQKTLGAYGIQDGDMVMLAAPQQQQQQQRRQPSMPAAGGFPQIDFSSIQIPGSVASTSGAPPQVRQAPPAVRQQGEPDPSTLRDMILADPGEVSLLKERNPPLAEALLSGDLAKFTQVLESQRRERAEREMQRIRMLNADPFDATAQEQIAEAIRLKNVESNMETAMEHSPESFGQVVMLYIDVTVNNHPVKAFVDSGAQMTIMSQACAERCNIMRLVDKRWAGIAKGVGTQKIIGRVHLGQIQIGNDFLPSSFSILEDQPMDMLLGLDMLKRHQCSIDLKRNLLSIGTTGTETKFLGEAELPVCARLNRTEAPDTATLESEDRQLAEALTKSAESAAGPSGTSSSTSSNPSAAASSASTPTPATTGNSSSSTTTTTSSSSASSQPPPQASTQPQPQQQTQYPEATIKSLTDMGFAREQAVQELRVQNGDVNKAAAALFAKSFKLPGQ